jgi:hypothetical protein
MNTYAAFGVGLGNLGRQSRVRIAKTEWIAHLNRGLARLHTDTVIIAAYGHTGNFIVRSTEEPDALVNALREVLRTHCALTSMNGLQVLVTQLSTASTPTGDTGVRLTPGAALLADGVPRSGDLQGTSAPSISGSRTASCSSANGMRLHQRGS